MRGIICHSIFRLSFVHSVQMQPCTPMMFCFSSSVSSGEAGSKLYTRPTLLTPFSRL